MPDHDSADEHVVTIDQLAAINHLRAALHFDDTELVHDIVKHVYVAARRFVDAYESADQRPRLRLVDAAAAGDICTVHNQLHPCHVCAAFAGRPRQPGASDGGGRMRHRVDL